MDDKPTRRAILECGRWLVACRNHGWRREDLDFLEALWWKYHDRNGNLTKGSPDD